MRPWRASTPVKFPVGLKFACAVGAVALGVLTVAVTAGIGPDRTPVTTLLDQLLLPRLTVPFDRMATEVRAVWAITVSIGVGDLIQHGGDASGLLRQADRALYTAKATGRNRVVIAGADDPPAENDEVAVLGVLGSSSKPD